uniref:Uncharacterized protein n=1 Tax=Polynucleobacter necessarius subsp. necessarius (strain STIR1) TaxID=452638 RepID=B1XTX1_POLNS
MATQLLQVRHLQKFLLLALPFFLAACILSQPDPKRIVQAQPNPTPIVRPPKVG